MFITSPSPRIALGRSSLLCWRHDDLTFGARLIATAQARSDTATETLTVRVVREVDSRIDSSTAIADAMATHVLQRNGRDSVLAFALTTATGDVTFPLRRDLRGEISVRRVGFASQRIPIPPAGDARLLEVRMLHQTLELAELCSNAMGPVVVLQVGGYQGTKPLALHVRIWTDRPQKIRADSIPELVAGGDSSLQLDAPYGQPFTNAVRAAGDRQWSRSAVVARGPRSCGGPGVILDVPLRRVRSSRVKS